MSESLVKLFPLGGMGKVTQNMFLYETDDEILIIDCGIGFPDSYMPGVDVLIPDITYLLKQIESGKKVVGMILTHGHDDHIGATPFILPHLPTFPIYGSPLTLGFAAERIKESGLEPDLRVVKPREQFQISSNFTATAYNVTHSVPDTMHYAIETPAGLIYHGSDFKLDPTPVDGRVSDLEGIGQLQGQVKLMLVDCLRVETPQRVKSESSVGPEIEKVMSQTRGKFVLTLMSSHIHRIQQAVDAAYRHNRKIAFVGRSVERNVEVAERLGMLSMPKGMLINKKKMDQYRDNELCVIVAGSQGQEGSSLVRAIFGDHPALQIMQEDTVVFSADAIPGNEINYFGAIDELARNRIHVVYPEVNHNLHQSGHASIEEQLELVDLLKPEFVMPIGGQDRHRVKFWEEVAQPLGFDDRHSLMPETGEVMGISQGGIRIVDHHPLRPQVVDGLGVGDVGPVVLSDRRSLGQAGMVVVVIPRTQGKFQLNNIQVVSRGFVFMKEATEVVGFINQTVAEVIKENHQKKDDEIKRLIEKKLSRKLYKVIQREPMIVTVLMDVK